MNQVHPTAIIDPSARLGEDVEIGPYTIVEADVRIGDGSRIGAHVTLGERLELGRHVRVYNYACLGTASQDLKHRGEISSARIGDDSIVREFVTVNRGTREGSRTLIGNGVALLAYAHVAHECVVEDGVILVNAATLGGEVHVGRHAVIGGLSGVHQFCRIGAHAMVGACSKVTQDVPPFLIADGHPARPFGPNQIGLERRGFSAEEILRIRQIYAELYRERLLEESLAGIAARFANCPLAREVTAFCRGTQRGFIRPRRGEESATETSRVMKRLELELQRLDPVK